MTTRREELALLGERAADELAADLRVDRSSLDTKIRIMRSHPWPSRRGDIGAELRVAVRLLKDPQIAALRFRETPDLEFDTGGMTCSIEVARLRRARGDDEADGLIAASRAQGVLRVLPVVSTWGQRGAEVEHVRGVVTRKLTEGAATGPAGAVVLVGDSDWRIDDGVLRDGIRAALRTGAPPTASIVIAWDSTSRPADSARPWGVEVVVAAAVASELEKAVRAAWPRAAWILGNARAE